MSKGAILNKGGDATTVSYDNSATSSIISSDNVQGAIDQLFQSVSNGKNLIAGAITDKGVSTSGTDTFQQMANNIASIQSGFSGISFESSQDNVNLINYKTESLFIPFNRNYNFICYTGSIELRPIQGYANTWYGIFLIPVTDLEELNKYYDYNLIYSDNVQYKISVMRTQYNVQMKLSSSKGFEDDAEFEHGMALVI